MDKQLVYEDRENQLGVDKDGNIIDLCSENNKEERFIDLNAMLIIVRQSVMNQRMKLYGSYGN